MNKVKFEKGITLIALIITIIILLILAVVTIGSIKDSNIITYAQNASRDYNTEKDKEESTILSYEQLIDDSINPPEELNFWQERGLTSENVKFDTLYKGTINLDGSNEVMHFCLYSNGDICVNFSETDTDINIKDEEGNNNTGNNGGDKQFVETYEEFFEFSTNTFTLPLNRVGDDYMTLRYTDNNTVEVYYGESSDFDKNGHIPETVTYHKGTLTLLEK